MLLTEYIQYFKEDYKCQEMKLSKGNQKSDLTNIMQAFWYNIKTTGNLCLFFTKFAIIYKHRKLQTANNKFPYLNPASQIEIERE